MVKNLKKPDLERVKSPHFTLLRRAKLDCTESTDLKEELEYIEKMMQLNQFPKVIVKKAIHETLSKSKPSKKKNEDDEYTIRMYMSYEIGNSENITRIGKKFNVKLVHTKGKSLKNMFVRNITTSLEKQKQSGVVYRVTCGDCGSQYVGETRRSLETRMDEHTDKMRKEKLRKYLDFQNIYVKQCTKLILMMLRF